MELFDNERIIQINGKNIIGKLAPVALAVSVLALAILKLTVRKDPFVRLFHIADVESYRTLSFAEWYALALIGIIAVIWFIRLAGRKLILTSDRIVLTSSPKKVRNIISVDKCMEARATFTGTIILKMASGTVRLPHFQNANDTVIALSQCKTEKVMERNTQQPPVKVKVEEPEKKAAVKQDDTPKESPTEKLNKLIGLNPVKKEILRLENYVSIMKLRREKGLPVSTLTLHTVFEGNPGTGKTTVARIMAAILKENGVLAGGHLVETDRSGLIGEYVGQTAVKTNTIIDRALDGVLFVDEAYTLSEGGQNDYGQEAIATLLKRMEDDRERLVVILAGYTDNMERFLDTNPGLRSRFTRKINFPDYSATEMQRIFQKMCDDNGYILSEDAVKRLKEVTEREERIRDKRSGNGRFVRNTFEMTIQNQASRLAANLNNTYEQLKTIEYEDIPER